MNISYCQNLCLAGLVLLWGASWTSSPPLSATPEPETEAMVQLQKLEEQGRLTVRALGAWGLLENRHQQLALRLRGQNLDLLAADRSQIQRWLDDVGRGHRSFERQDLELLAELLALMQLDSPDALPFDDPDLEEPLQFELPTPQFIQPPQQVSLATPHPDLDDELCADLDLSNIDDEDLVLPPLAADTAPDTDWLTTPLAQRVSTMSQNQYAQSVVYTRELMRQFLAPQGQAESEAFDAAWMQLEAFPSARVVQWLDRLNPLLAEWIALVQAMDMALAAFEETRFEAEMAAYFEHEAYTDRALQQMGRIVNHLQSLYARIGQVTVAVEALGEPPDPVTERCHAQEEFRRHLAALQGEFPLEGAYEMSAELVWHADSEHPARVAYEREPPDTRLDSVIKRLRTERDGTTLFYRFQEIDRDSAPSLGLGFDDEDDWWEVFHAEPVPGGWVRYQLDAAEEEEDEPETLEINWFRVQAGQLLEDWFLIQEGQLVDAQRTVHQRKPTGAVVREYGLGESQATVEQSLRELSAELREALQRHHQGRQAYQAWVQAGASLPLLPHPDELHWVLSDLRVDERIDNERVVRDTGLLEERRLVRSARVSPHGLELEWDTLINEYEIRHGPGAVPAHTPDQRYVPNPDDEGPAGRANRVLTRSRTEPGHASLSWTEPPILLRDGQSWALHPHGSGTWRWSIGGLFNPVEPEVSGMPVPVLKGGPLDVHDQDPEGRLHQPVLMPEMTTSTALESRGDSTRAQMWLHFDSGLISRSQHEHVVPIVIGSPGGTVRIELVYSLQALDRRQQAFYAGMTLEDWMARGVGLADAETDQPEIAPQAIDDQEMMARKIAFHEENIRLLEEDLKRYEQQLVQAEDEAGQRFMAELILGKQADLQAQHDAVTSLTTGQFTRTRTGWDDMVLMQAQEHSRQISHNIAAELRSHQALERAMDLIPTHAYAETRSWVLSRLGDDYDQETMREVVQHVLQRGMALNRIEAMEHMHGDEAEANQLILDVLETTRHTSDTFLGYAMYVAPLVTGGGALAIGYGLASGSVHGYQTGGRLGPEYRGGAGMALTAIETAARFYAPSIDYAITFHDGYQAGGLAVGTSQLAISFVRRKAMQQAYRTVGGFKHQWETRDARAAARNQAWRDNLRLQNHRQEKAYGKALVQHHQDAYNTYRAASRAGAPRSQLATLDAQLMDLTAAVKHSPYAKAYLKFEASAQVQARYNATDRLHTQRIVREFRTELSRSGFDIDQLSMRPIRNAGNVTPGMDLDLNVVSRDGRIVRYRDPVTGVERNMDLYSANKLWQDAFSKVYARNSGSRSARQSWQMVTSDAHLEAYHTEGGAMSPWIRICSIRGRGDVLGASRSALDLIDPRYASDAGRITEFKAHEMRHMMGMGRDLQNMEIFRGTAKDIRTKIQPLLVDRLRQPLTPQQRAKTIATRDYYNRLLEAMDMAYDDPVAAEREVRLITGRHPVESVHMVTMGIESLGLFH